MIYINDKVKSKNEEGSFQTEGKVVALMTSEHFLSSIPPSWNPGDTWSEKFPDWDEKPIVLVEFDKPQKTATIEEWVAGAKKAGVEMEEALETYYTKCPVTKKTAFPLDDLDVIKSNAD